MTATPRWLPDALRSLGDHDTVTVDGRTISYAEFGAPDGAPVVAFHGAPGSRWFGALYHDAGERAGVRVIAPERPGYGRSDPAPGRGLAGWSDDVSALADTLGVDSFGLVGFSAGAPYALACAARLPDRSSGTALVSPAGPPDGPPGPVGIRALRSAATRAPWLLRPVVRGMAALERSRAPEAVAGRLTDSAAALDERVAGGATYAEVAAADILGASAGGPDGFVTDLRHQHREWPFDPSAVPDTVRIWHGSADGNVPLAAAEALAARLSGADLTVRGGEDHGHVAVRTRAAVLEAAADD